MRGWHDLRTSLDWAFDGELEPQFRRRTFVPRGTTAWFIRAGRVTLEQSKAGRTLRVREGEWVFLSERVVRQDFARGARLLSIRFDARWLSGRPLYTHEEPRVLQGHAHRNLTAAGTALAAEVSDLFGARHTELPAVAGTASEYFRLRARFHDWLTAYSTVMEQIGIPSHAPGAGDPRVAAALALVEHAPLAPPPTAGRVAAAVGVSGSQLHRLLGRDGSTSLRRLLDARRRERAAAALRLSDDPIKSIAAELGFSSVQHFTLWCTRHLGATPAAFRRRVWASGSMAV
ncbi:MAG TPA: AraC family transcriptional regulator [Tepidisphaeraceae bacterium]|nr:AraC family transcriptional regulator [Tepidisphaeraceae bacterium]